MCGFCGAVSPSRVDIDSMVESISHRGPDSQGIYRENNLTLGHTRLSIQDLSDHGNQPMISKSKRFVIAFNGEIYNFLELKNELSKLGVTFYSNSDTEVILEGYEVWGENFFRRLNGMFAFAIFDRQEQQLLLIRDRFGIKPLYYMINSKEFFFGSEIKSLLASGLVHKEINFQGFHEYLHFSTTLGKETFFRGICKLLPGHVLKYDIKSRSHKIITFIQNYDVPVRDDSLEIAVETIRNLFEKSVKSQLISDVPVGVFLSGGIDSTAITAFASRHYNGPLKTFSAGFDFDEGVNELPNARYISEQFGTDHTEFYIKGGDIPVELENLNSYFDQPFGDAANLPLYLMSKELKGRHKVILQGDGGDEIFAGYHRYRRLKYYNLFKLFSKMAYPLRGFVPKDHPRYKNFRSLYALYQQEKDKEAAYIMSQEMVDENPVDLFKGFFQQQLKMTDPFIRYSHFYHEFKCLDPLQRMLYTDMNIILPDLYFEKVDRSTMANSIEIRVPFLDNELVSYVMGLPSSYKVRGKQKKYLLKKAFKDIVPDRILFGPKQGFGVPFQYWLKGPMKEYMYDVIGSQPNIFSPKVSLLMNEHVKGTKDNGYILWKLLNLASWMNKAKLT